MALGTFVRNYDVGGTFEMGEWRSQVGQIPRGR